MASAFNQLKGDPTFLRYFQGHHADEHRRAKASAFLNFCQSLIG
jgi:hypothetical protein